MDLFGSGPLVATCLEELGPELVRLGKAPRHHEDVHEVARRDRLVRPEPPAPGERERRLGVLFGPREVVCHAEVGQVAFRSQLYARQALALGDRDAPLEQCPSLLGASGVRKKYGLQAETLGRAARRARGAGPR